MTTESLEHIFIFIGIISTWLFQLWLYFRWLRYDDKILTDYVSAMGYSIMYFTFIAHYFEFTVSVSI